jgi:hypothetical protein
MPAQTAPSRSPAPAPGITDVFAMPAVQKIVIVVLIESLTKASAMVAEQDDKVAVACLGLGVDF